MSKLVFTLYFDNPQMCHHDERRLPNKLGHQYRRSGKIFHLLLPGTAITYYGEEIGMEDIWVSYEDTQDPFAKDNPVSCF